MRASLRPKTGLPYLDDPQGVVAFAHRGGATHPELGGMENTEAAFDHAVALGYRYLETDVHATSDGVLLAFHDSSLDRVTGTPGLVAELRHAEMADALIGGRHVIPRLEGLFERYPAARFNIDIKAGTAVEPLADLLRRTRAHDRVCVGSFSEPVRRRFRSLLDRPVATSCGPRAVVATRFGGALDRPLQALLADPGMVFQVPHRHRGLRIATPTFVRRAHATGRHVHVWTIDDPEEMRELLDMGVDGIFSDRTDLLRDVLMERGLWEGSTT